MAVIATCRDVVDRAEDGDRVVRQLGANAETEALDLLRWAGQPGRPSALFQPAAQMYLPPAAWRAGVFVANELRGVVRAEDVTRAGRIEVKLFVDEGWRRQELARCCSRRSRIGHVTVTQARFAWFAREPTGRCGILRKNSEPGSISCSDRLLRIFLWCWNEP